MNEERPREHLEFVAVRRGDYEELCQERDEAYQWADAQKAVVMAARAMSEAILSEAHTIAQHAPLTAAAHRLLYRTLMDLHEARYARSEVADDLAVGVIPRAILTAADARRALQEAAGSIATRALLAPDPRRIARDVALSRRIERDALRCSALHPERSHRCRRKAGHEGPHRSWGAGREHHDNLTWEG